MLGTPTAIRWVFIEFLLSELLISFVSQLTFSATLEARYYPISQNRKVRSEKLSKEPKMTLFIKWHLSGLQAQVRVTWSLMISTTREPPFWTDSPWPAWGRLGKMARHQGIGCLGRIWEGDGLYFSKQNTFQIHWTRSRNWINSVKWDRRFQNLEFPSIPHQKHQWNQKTLCQGGHMTI